MLMQVGRKTILIIQWSINQDYIAKTLCENKNKPSMKYDGKCHLKKELVKTEEHNNANSKSKVPNIQDEIVLFSQKLNPQIYFSNSNFHSFKKVSFSLTNPLHSILNIGEIWHPPSYIA